MKTIHRHYRFDQDTYNILQINREKHTETKSESDYIRQLIHRDYVSDIGFRKEDIITMKRQLIGIGRNINQIAHRINAGDYTSDDIQALRTALVDVTASKTSIDQLLAIYDGRL